MFSDTLQDLFTFSYRFLCTAATPCVKRLYYCKLPSRKKLQWKLLNEGKKLIEMASVTVRGCALGTVSLLNFAFVFISGADFIQFISFSAIYHNITGETTLCRGKPPDIKQCWCWQVNFRETS